MKKSKILKISLIVFLSIIVIVLASILIFVQISINPIKHIDVSLTNNENIYSKIYTSDNQPTNYTDNLKNEYIHIDEIPEITRQAFISIEDKEFYNHNGLNYKRIAKASLNNLKSGSFKEGASTITQQLVKNRFLSNEKTFDRKIKEAYLSKKLESVETKDKILETYLNTIYFGNGAYGIGDACKTFFNKELKELNLVESAVLAGCIKSPSNYSPLNNYKNASERKNLVLKEMYKDNKITEEEYLKATNEEIDISNSNVDYNKSKLDLYSQYVLDEASKILNTNTYNILHGNYKIYTYQDSNIQKNLNNKINDNIYYHQNEYGNTADSLAMIIDNKTGGVSAISGKSDYNLVNFKRQPGSLIKPILVYMPAIEEGLINEKTQILDEEINYNGYSPKNVGNKYYGYVSVEDCVAKSLNIPAIKVCEKVGLEKCKSYARKCGIEFNETYDNGYALALGGFTDGVTLKDITDSYSVLASKGNYIKSSFIKKIVNNNNMTLYDNVLSENKVYNTDTSFLMTKILDYSVDTGTSKKLNKLDFDVAGKTGTVALSGTNLNTDAYSLAYTTNHTMSVWLGNYSMDEKYYLSGSNNGGTYATQLINDTFAELYTNQKPHDFEIPETVEECVIDVKSLEENHIVVLGDNIPERYQEKAYFSKRYLPTQYSTKFNEIIPFDFNVITYKNSCEISFDSYDYIDYEIYRNSNGKSIKIESIKNHNGWYSYIDNNIENNTVYTYFIKATSNYSDDIYTTKEKKVFLEKEYANLIKEDTTQDLSWLFG